MSQRRARDLRPEMLASPARIRTRTVIRVGKLTRELKCVVPTFLTSEDEPVALVASLNAQRRNLTPAQRAIAAAEAWDWMPKGTKAEVRAKKLAPMFGVNNAYVSMARALVDDDPPAAEAVKEGIKPCWMASPTRR